MSLFKKLAGDTALYGLSTIVGRLLNWLLLVVHTRVFEEPRLLADNSQLYIYVAVLNIVYTFGMETAFFRFASKKENQQDYFNLILSYVIVFGTSVSSIFIFFSTPLINAIGYPGKERLIFWLSVILVIDAICAIAFVKLRSLNQARRFVQIKLAAIFINIGLQVFYLMFCNYVLKGKITIVSQQFASFFYNPDIGPDYIIWANYVSSLITMVLLYREFIGFRFNFDWERFKPVLVYAYPLLIMGLAGTINLTADRLMFRALLPENFYAGQTTEQSFSIYSQVYKLSIFMTLIVQAYRYAADPFFFSKMGDKNSPTLIATSTKWFTIGSIILWVVVSLNLDWISLLIGKTYREGIYIVPILLLANLFIGLYGNISIWYKLSDKTQYGTYITFLGMFVAIVLNFILIPKFGYLGCAISFLSSSFLMVLSCFYFGQKHFYVPYEIRNIIFYIILGGSIILLNYQINIPGLSYSIPIHLLICIVFCAIIFLFEYSKSPNLFSKQHETE